MPIYEYVCSECGKRFDRLWPSVAAAEKAAEGGETPPCPACESQATQRMVSQVAVLGSLGGLTPGEQTAAKAQAERLASITPKEQIQQLQANRQKEREQKK